MLREKHLINNILKKYLKKNNFYQYIEKDIAKHNVISIIYMVRASKDQEGGLVQVINNQISFNDKLLCMKTDMILGLHPQSCMFQTLDT